MARFGAERANERARISRGCTWAWHSDRSREGRTMHRSAHRGVGFPPMSARASVHCQGQAAPPSLLVPLSSTRSRGPSEAIKSPIKTGEACPFITVRAPRILLSARATGRQFAEICGLVPLVHYTTHFQLGHCQRGSQCTATCPHSGATRCNRRIYSSWGKTHERKVTKSSSPSWREVEWSIIWETNFN